MKWTMKQLREKRDELTHFTCQLDLREQLMARNADIIHVDPVQVTGYFVAREHEIFLHCQAQTIVTLPSTRTLAAVPVGMEVPIDERYVYPEADVNAEAYEETTIVLEHDYIDLDLAVIDNLLMNLPMRVVGVEELDAPLPSGHDWQVITEDDYQQQVSQEKAEQLDPRFASLKALLNEEEADE